MKTLLALLLMTTPALSQTVNNAIVNIQGVNQSVSITQSGASHSATLNLSGDNISAIVSQYDQILKDILHSFRHTQY